MQMLDGVLNVYKDLLLVKMAKVVSRQIITVLYTHFWEYALNVEMDMI